MNSEVEAEIRRVLAVAKLELKIVDEVIDEIGAYLREYEIRQHKRLRQQRRHQPTRRDSAKDKARALAKSVAALEARIDARMPSVNGVRTVVLHSMPQAMLDQCAMSLRPALQRLRELAELNACQDRPSRRDEPRLLLECGIAATLEAAGVTLSATDYGTLTKILRVVHRAIGVTRGESAKSESAKHSARRVIAAMDEWRALPVWHRQLPEK